MLSVHVLLAAIWARVIGKRQRLAARTLRGFARAELGSMYAMRWAAAATADLDKRALYLRHAADEARHARLFQRRASELDDSFPPLRADAEDLFARLGEARFLAFVSRAEARAGREFRHYARAFRKAGDERSAALFDGIIRDEDQHERYSRQLLEASEDPPRARRDIVAWEAWRSSRRMGRRLAGSIYWLSMLLLYPLLGPLALWQRWRHRDGSGGRRHEEDV